MIQNPQSEPVSTARDIAEALGRSPNEKGVDRLAADLAEAVALDGAPTATEANIRTIKSCVQRFDETGLAEYINLLLGIAYVRGQRSEIQHRIDEIGAVVPPLAFRPDGSGADCLPLDPFDGGCPADTRGGGA